MSALDAKQQSLLAKHPANPDPIPASPVIHTKAARSALKDTIAAQKRANAAGTRELPVRPRSALKEPTPAHSAPVDGNAAAGRDLPVRPRSALKEPTPAIGKPAEVTSVDDKIIETPEESAALDDLFIKKAEPEKAKEPESKPERQQDSIFGAKRAKEAQQKPQQEQVSTSASLSVKPQWCCKC